MKKVLVKCSYEIEVEVPEEWDDHQIDFDIEENHCPGTGIVGAAFDEHYQKCLDYEKEHNGAGYCWACCLKGKNEVI